MVKISKKLVLSIFISSFVFNLSANALEIDDYTINAIKILDPSHIDQNVANIQNLINQVEKKLVIQEKSYKNTNYSKSREYVDQAKKSFYLLKSNYKSDDISQVERSENKILSDLREAQFNLMPSRVVEVRGLYLDADSIPNTKLDVISLIKKIKQANFNIIYPEVFRRGYAIFPNNVADIDDRFKNIDFDILKTIIEEAHKENIEVYPWIWTFRIKSPLYEDSFFKKYPELIARRDKYKFEDREPLFLSPAEPKARILILRMLRTMTINYKIDGLLLDYIRYDETLGDDLLTQKYFREYFINKYHQEPPINIKKDSPFFNEFQLWREEQVTIMVKAVKRELNTIKPEIKIGAAIFRTEREGRLLKMQDWRHWSNNQYINFLCPMLYTDNNKELNEWINSETDNNTRFDYIYPSLGAHRFYSADDFYHEVGLLHQRNIPGMNIFSLLHLGIENLPDLAHGVFRKPAYLPEKSTINSVKLILSDTENWLRKISKLETLSGFGKIKNIIYKIVQTNSGLHPNNKDQYNVNELKKEISDIKKYTQSANKNENIPELLIPEIIEPLNYVLRLIEIDSHKKETKNDYFPSTSPSTIKR